MNVELLEKVKKRILKQPKRLNMQYWGTAVEGCGFVLQIPPCKTQACIAGETVLAKRLVKIDKVNGGFLFPKGEFRIADKAAALLNLSNEQADRLFYTKSIRYNGGCWPAQFDKAYKEALTPLERAKVAAARIDHFIATNGAE